MDPQSVLVAVVDDEESVRTGLARLLRAAGYETSTHASGGEFLTSLEKRLPDCVILDFCMPAMDAEQVQARMADAGHHVSIIVITGQEVPGARERTLRAGASRFLRKPVDEINLISAIEAAVRQRQFARTRLQQLTSAATARGEPRSRDTGWEREGT